MPTVAAPPVYTCALPSATSSCRRFSSRAFASFRQAIPRWNNAMDISDFYFARCMVNLLCGSVLIHTVSLTVSLTQFRNQRLERGHRARMRKLGKGRF